MLPEFSQSRVVDKGYVREQASFAAFGVVQTGLLLLLKNPNILMGFRDGTLNKQTEEKWLRNLNTKSIADLLVVLHNNQIVCPKDDKIYFEQEKDDLASEEPTGCVSFSPSKDENHLLGQYEARCYKKVPLSKVGRFASYYIGYTLLIDDSNNPCGFYMRVAKEEKIASILDLTRNLEPIYTTSPIKKPGEFSIKELKVLMETGTVDDMLGL